MKTALLVIDDDLQRAEELSLLLRFMEESHVACTAFADWRTHVENSPDLRAIFLDAGEVAPTEVSAILQTLQAAAPQVDLVLIEDAERPARWPAALEVDCRARLSRPFRHSQLGPVLAKLQRRDPRAGRGAQDRRGAELFRSLIGHSPTIVRVRELVQRVAPSEATVLILGESGTGKEVVARNIHYFSPRSHGPFVPINCGAIPDNLLESELFGHEKGAFTGAISARRGRFELAQGGTLFLDEIGDMPLNMQVKLLRVLQEHTFERVGSDRSLKTDVRIIAATHRRLEDLIEAGQFREDLYYRLNVFPIETPPLRERSEDLPLLIQDLGERIAHEQRLRVTLGPAALRCLGYYPWPGNVRELANLMERLAILQPDGVVGLDDLPSKFRAYYPEELAAADATVERAMLAAAPPPVPSEPINLPPDGLDLRQHIIDIESSLIHSALEDANGVVAHAATLLKMRRTTLVEKMRKYRIKRDEEDE
ncbi:MAG: sigma-54-dependent Fis family transcriptional regulator [Candidatus Competibacteraceae bacterium]|nr:MAG: sigma-54-dependent Fis family transcriptional regulator [Candidatus Competibacteraceae bacterium]